MAKKKKKSQRLTIKIRYADGSIWLKRVGSLRGAGRRYLKTGGIGFGFANKYGVAAREGSKIQRVDELTAGHFGLNGEGVAKDMENIRTFILEQDSGFRNSDIRRKLAMNIESFEHSVSPPSAAKMARVQRILNTNFGSKFATERE